MQYYLTLSQPLLAQKLQELYKEVRAYMLLSLVPRSLPHKEEPGNEANMLLWYGIEMRLVSYPDCPLTA